MLKCILLQILLFQNLQSAKILVLFPTPSVSHESPFRPLMETLANKGHELTIMTTDPSHYTDSQYPNSSIINIEKSFELFSKFNFVKKNEEKLTSNYKILKTFMTVMNNLPDIQFGSPDFQKLLNNPETRFDLCMSETYYFPGYAFKDRFKCSLIIFSSISGLINTFEEFGCPSNPVLYPDMNTPYYGDLSIWQKIDSVYEYIAYQYLYRILMPQSFNPPIKKYFGVNAKSIKDLVYQVDMMFLANNLLFGNIRPSVPAIIHVGGMHIKANKPLPNEYQKFLDESPHGAIYFSLGSNVKSAELPDYKRKQFIEAFKSMPYNVLWKWENETMEDKPSNVVIAKWLPQQDILAHPNVKLFITQGGQQSLEEAIHHKVPLVGFPFIGDQFLNVKKIVKFGIGDELHHETLSKQIIIDTIQKVVLNSTYKKTISKLSVLINDQPQTSLERAVWWTEYVLRHKGASHLRAPAVGVPFYEYFLLDVIGFVLGCLAVAIFVTILLIKFLIRYLSNLVNKIKEQSKKNQ